MDNQYLYDLANTCFGNLRDNFNNLNLQLGLTNALINDNAELESNILLKEKEIF